MENNARALCRYCRDLVGDGLRGVVAYYSDSNTVLYLREDLRQQVDGAGLTPTMERARAYHEMLESVSSLQPTLGAPDANVAVFGEVLVMLLFYDAETGMVLTFERDVGRDLIEFVMDCQQILQEPEPV